MASRNLSQLLPILLLCALCWSGPQTATSQTTPGEESTPSPKGSGHAKATFWLIPHTHWEGAVFKTREEYLEIGLPHILKALQLLKEYPEYRFVLDQVAYARPFLERHTEEAAAFRKFVADERIELVGAQNIMPDVNMPGGESWIRQVLYGKSYYREKFGVDVTVGWGLDSFGHHAQMPQLLKLAGYKSYWFQRGVRNDGTPSEFIWEGIDGTRIPAFWLPSSYALFHPAPGSLLEFDRYARRQWDELGRFSTRSNRVALVGADVTEPEEAVPRLVREFNQKDDIPFVLRFGVPTDFAKIVAEKGNSPVVRGELNPLFQGVYSSRIELKQWLRQLERALVTAETLSALAAWLGKKSDNEGMMAAWEPVLFNQAHDLIAGTIVDKVYEETVRGYQSSQSLADGMIDSDIDVLASRIDTRGQGIPLLVFNSLGGRRTDLAETEVVLSERGIRAVKLLDSAGREVPLQYLSIERIEDGGIRHVRIAFIARDVPALGYALYRLAPQADAPRGAWPEGRTITTMHEDSGSIENEFYRATFDLWTGEMTRLEVKPGGWNALGDGPANIVAREQDGGDLWELYGTLNGARLTPMTRQHGRPAPGRAHLSNEWIGGDGAIVTGAVFSEFRISHPLGDGRFATRVRLYPGIRRVDFKTEILNNDKGVRYRVLFPTSVANGPRFDEIPFGAIQRPNSMEFPAQNWIDYSDGNRGVALLNRGLPGNNVAGGTLMLSLMRSARISAYPFIGGYEPGVSSDLGLELGVERSFDYALIPHEGDWRAAEIYRAGWEFNRPLVVRRLTSHGGGLPPRWGLLEISHANVVVSALKPGPDGTVVLRMYEAAGRPTYGVKIGFNVELVAAQESNLIEEAGRAIPVADNAIQFDFGPYEIKTFRLKLRSFAESK